MMTSLIWILACPLGMFAMGGVVWVASRLPGRRAERVARTASRASCMSMGAKQPPAKVEQDTSAESAEEKVPTHV
jgi:hypothetical protein